MGIYMHPLWTGLFCTTSCFDRRTGYLLSLFFSFAFLTIIYSLNWYASGFSREMFSHSILLNCFSGLLSPFFLYHALVIELFFRVSVSLRFTISCWNFVDISQFDSSNTYLCLFSCSWLFTWRKWWYLFFLNWDEYMFWSGKFCSLFLVLP